MLKTIALGLACLLVSVPASAQDTPDYVMRTGFVALAAVSFADIETTGRALERGFTEKNPILRPFADTPGMAGLVSGGLSAGIGLGAYALHKKGNRSAARIVVWAWTIVRGLVVLHNVRQLRR